MFGKLIPIACALAIGIAPVMAQDPPPPPPGEAPHLVLMPPEGTEPPEGVGEPPGDPEAAAEWLSDIFFDMMDANGDGALSPDEFLAWVAHAHIPPMHPPEGDMGGGDMGGGESWAQGECNGAMGNEVIRELSINPGPNAVAISLPGGREAGCFFLEGAESATFELQIIEELGEGTDPALMWHSDDGQEAYETLVLAGAEDGSIYHVELLGADPDTQVFTVRYIDYPAAP